MTKNNSTNLSSWRVFVKKVKKGARVIQRGLRDFSLKYPNISQIIQLTFIYFFAVVDLIYSILNNVFALGYMPEILLPFFPLIKKILTDPILRIWASPEKVFFLSYVTIEFMIVRPTFKFSKLVKYNVLLIFSMLMLQGLMVSYWDVLFHRQIATPVARWAYDGGALIFTDKPLAIVFFLNTFLIFIGLYVYLYFKAINNRFATFYGVEWLTDSVAFWLRIKTPTMRFGKRKKDKKDKGKET
jgi:hypothetical protein